MVKMREKTKSRSKPKTSTSSKSSRVDTDILTLEEAATYLKLPKRVLEEQVDLGTIPGRNIAGHWRFFKPTLNQWLSEEPSKKKELSSKELFLSQAGVFANDPTFPQLIEQIYANRRRLDSEK
jgi:excisionase family DNA binding protein